MLIDLLKPWSNKRQIVCADSYFVSVPAVGKLEKIGLHFVGVVKTATKKYPMNRLNRNYLPERGDYKKLVSINKDDASVRDAAIMWLDKNCRFLLGIPNLPPLNIPSIVLCGVRWSNRVIFWSQSWRRLS